MKLFQIVSFAVAIVSVLSFSSSVFAAVQFYGADVELDDAGNSKIKLTITFQEPVAGFNLPIFAAVKNFDASSNSGPVDCSLTTGDASIVICKLNLTQEKRTVELRFETPDFVRRVDGRSLFSLDLSINQQISQAVTTVKLPEGYALANSSSVPAILPSASNIVSDGRRIIVNWNSANVTSEQPFKFQTLYEPIKNAFPIALISTAIIGSILTVIGIILFKRSKKPQEVILSVLDDFEKKVIEVISASGGEVNQRKVVLETNLSKAKVSRVVKRLQERGLLEVTRLGRTNKLKLVQKKFEGN